MADKEYTGLWIPKGMLACKELKHIEKLVLAATINFSDGLRMSDKSLADQFGVSESSIRGILRSMIDKGFLVKVGTHKTRKFLPTAQGCALTDDANCATLRNQPRKAAHLTAQGCAQKEYKTKERKEDFLEESNYPSKCNQLPFKAQSITPRVRHKEYKIKENKEGEASAKKVETNVDKDEALEESNTSQQAATSLWMTYMNPATGRNFMSKPKIGTWIYNPATGESKEYEGE